MHTPNVIWSKQSTKIKSSDYYMRKAILVDLCYVHTRLPTTRSSHPTIHVHTNFGRLVLRTHKAAYKILRLFS
jgi:hypothetical protein